MPAGPSPEEPLATRGEGPLQCAGTARSLHEPQRDELDRSGEQMPAKSAEGEGRGAVRRTSRLEPLAERARARTSRGLYKGQDDYGPRRILST